MSSLAYSLTVSQLKTDLVTSINSVESKAEVTSTSGPEHNREQIILETIPELAHVVAHYYKTEDSREDMMQDVVAHLMIKFDSFKGKSPFLHWALRITSNLCISKLRREKLRRFFSLDPEYDVESNITSSEELITGEEQCSLLRDCIDDLKPREKEIIVLSDMMEKDDAEVASILGISAGNVRVRRHRARLHLKKILTARGYQHDG